jgi:hypothetical protein
MMASMKAEEETFFCPDSAALSPFAHRLYHGVPHVDARQGDDPLPLLWSQVRGAFDGGRQEDSLPEMSDNCCDHGGDGNAAAGKYDSASGGS